VERLVSELLKKIRLPLFFIGLGLFFVAERHFPTETFHKTLLVIAAIMMALGILCTLTLVPRSKKSGLLGESKSWSIACLWMVEVFIGCVLYFAYTKVMGESAVPSTFPQKALLVLWLLALCFGLFAACGIEWSLRECGLGKLAEPQRVARAGRGWLAIGMLLVFLVCLNFFGSKKDIIRDWSYLKTTTASDSTKALLKSITEPVTVALFFSQGNDVRTLLDDYFQTLVASDELLKIESYDKDMHPTQAEKFKVTKNGVIVLERDGKRGTIDVGETIDKARSVLKKLDGEFQKQFLRLADNKKTIYFSKGHGEASWSGESSRNPLKGIKTIQSYLRQQNYTIKQLGLAEGSAKEIPQDASVVAIVGPSEPFQNAEVDALKAYLEQGGALLVFLESEKQPGTTDLPAGGANPLYGFLAEMGITFKDESLANDRNHVTATRSPADKQFIFSNSFTSHGSVVSLARHEEKIAILLFRTGHFEVAAQKGDWKAFATIRSLAGTFNDKNDNFKFDSATEKRSAYVMGAVAEKINKPKSPKDSEKSAQSRVAVLGDATAIADAVIRNPANAVYFADSLKWLIGESKFAGEIANEEDIKIRHTKKEDAIWFHGTVVFVPLLVLFAGFLATRRRPIAKVKKDEQA
jgi:hypothetical protein